MNAARAVCVACLWLLLVPWSANPQTRPSSVLIPKGQKLCPLAVPGTRPVRAGDRVLRIVEVRGWLRDVAPLCKAKDPAWYYLLEPDPGWTDSAAISLGDLLRVGNITGLVHRSSDRSPYRVVGTPLIRVEFGGWDPRKQGGPPPDDWRYADAPGCAGVRFAFDPLRPNPSGPRLAPGRYVRVIGSLVSDAPHARKATVGAWLFRNFGLSLSPEHCIYAAQEIWSEGGEGDPDNPARWSEIHPPDRIEPLPNRPPSETVRGVAICIRDGIVQDSNGPLTLSLSPPGPRPPWARGVRVRENLLAVSPRVTFDRAVAASRVKADGDVARISVDPREVGVEKFAAIYRVSWNPGGAVWTVVKRRGRY